VRVTDDVGVELVEVALRNIPRPGGPSFYDDFDASLESGTPQDGIWRFSMPVDKYTATGKWVGELVAAYSSGGTATLPDAGTHDEFWVKRNTMIRGFNVREPAAKGSYLRMSGRLLRLDPVRGYVGYRDKVIHVLFRAKGSPTLVKVGEIRTSATGSFANTRRFRARTDGSWLVLFNGTSNYLPEVSHRDFVDVT
jgi:hypothetical protein